MGSHFNIYLEVISKKSFRPISVLSPRIKSSTYLSMRVEDPVKRRGGLILGLVLISTENPNFEIASSGFYILPHVRAKTYVTANYSFKWLGGGGLFRLKNILSSQTRRSSARHLMLSDGRFCPERYRIETKRCFQK
jgi:hypothetical protein